MKLNLDREFLDEVIRKDMYAPNAAQSMLIEKIIQTCIDICIAGDKTQTTSGGAALLIKQHFEMT